MDDKYKYFSPDSLAGSLEQVSCDNERNSDGFIYIPRSLLGEKGSSSPCSNSMILYGVFVSDFIKGNSIVDYMGRHFVSYQIKDLRKLLNNCGHKTIWKYIDALCDHNLIQYDYFGKNKGYLFYLIYEEKAEV